MDLLPSEVNIMGIYWPPLLIVVTLAAIAMVVTIRLLNRHRLSRYFIFPEVVMLSLIFLYTSIIGTFIIPI